MKYRSRLDIIVSILRAASADAGVGRTRIMYEAYLSYAQLKQYVRFLTEKRLLSYDEETQAYKTTEKGTKLLRAAEEADLFIGVETRVQREIRS